MKVGLLLEGGAMRGIYTAGVLDVMMRQKIKVDGIVAVSAGALFELIIHLIRLGALFVII